MSLAIPPPADSESYRLASSWIQLVVEPMDPNPVYGQPPNPPPYYYGTPSDWVREPGHHPPVHPPLWAPNLASTPPIYGMPRPYTMSFDSQHQVGLSGGLPAPGIAPRSYQTYTHPMSTPHARPWTEVLPQMPGPVPVQPSPLGMQYTQPNVFPRQTSENELGQGQSGVPMESDSQPHGGYTAQYHPAPPMGQFPGSLSTPLQTTPMPVSQVRRPSYHSLSGIPPRASRAPLSPPYGTPPHYHDPSGLTPHAHRRSGHSRARRSVNNRLTVTDMSRDMEENGTHDVSGHRSDRDRVMSQLQGAVGTTNGLTNGLTTQQRNQILAEKMAARIARSLLEKVDIKDLPENERTCVICYNDYGVETPEGIHEEPLRLPKCKHIFGNYCLGRWFDDSDTCPYCREKVDLSTKHPDRVVNQLFTAMMSARQQLPPGATEEMYLRLVSNLVTSEGLSGSQDLTTSERRPFHANGDSDSSLYDDEIASSASSRAATATSPIRNSQRDNTRHSQWLPRPSQQRGAHPPLSQEREAPRHRRYRLPRGNNPSVAANTDSDSSDPSLSPSHAQQPDDAAQASSTIPSANGEDSGGLQNAIDIQSQATSTLVASTVQSRIRPW